MPAAHAELVHFRSVLPPGRAIVITRPLLRWWVAWTMETHFSTLAEPALAARGAHDAVLVLDEIRSGALGVVRGPPDMGALGAGVRDAARLRSTVATPLAERVYFRLSVVEGRSSGRSVPAPRVRPVRPMR